MDKKIKILVIPSDKSGCGFYRSVQPHTYIAEHYSDLFDIDIMYEFPTTIPMDKFLSQYNILHIHKQLDKECQVVSMAKFLGLKVIVDVDDHWKLGEDHPMSLTAKKEHWAEPIIKHLELADYVTTTTEVFANVIKKHNKNVIVFPNAINPEEKQFIPQPTESKRIRFGFICGSSHLKDFQLMEGFIKQLSKEYLDKIQIVLCGFDTNGTKTIYFQDTGKKEVRPIRPEESVWCDYEKIITDNYSIVEPDQEKFLKMYVKNMDYPNLDTVYRRCWTKPIQEYATLYNNIDVLLVPLKENEFNKVKSQLKVVEAGFFHKAIIAQDFGAYQIDLKPMLGKGNEIDETGNALLVETRKNHKNWAKYIKWIVDNPEYLKKLQDNLYDTVKDTYSLATVAKARAQKYLEICGVNDIILN